MLCQCGQDKENRQFVLEIGVMETSIGHNSTYIWDNLLGTETSDPHLYVWDNLGCWRSRTDFQAVLSFCTITIKRLYGYLRITQALRQRWEALDAAGGLLLMALSKTLRLKGIQVRHLMILRAWRRPQNNILKHHNYPSQQEKEGVNSQNTLQAHFAVIKVFFFIVNSSLVPHKERWFLQRNMHCKESWRIILCFL